MSQHDASHELRLHREHQLPQDPLAVRKLEELDDLIFPAIDGDLDALEASPTAWLRALDELGAEAVEETRSQYLRYARATWRFLVGQTVQQPLRMLAVMKIIGLLSGDDV